MYDAPTMKRTNIYLPEPMLTKLRRLASNRGVSVAELVRRAVEDFLGRNTR